MAWRRPFGDRAATSGTVAEGQVEQISNGSVQYIGEKGGNDAPPTYQDASGAPVENNSPLGYSVGPVTITLLNITMMIGAGIYTTRASSLRALRSSQGMLTFPSCFDSRGHWFRWCQFCLLDSWLLSKSPSLPMHATRQRQLEWQQWLTQSCDQLCMASGAVYLEFTAYFPSRSGSEVVFLEQAYPRPMWLFPTTFAVQSVILSFGSANATGRCIRMMNHDSIADQMQSHGKLPDCHIRP